MSKVAELYGLSTNQTCDWASVVVAQRCPFLQRKCLKSRKSEPDISIGTCTVKYGKANRSIIICPFRLLERSQIFTDCIHLLALHEPGNELRIVSELTVPGGSIDYCLVSVRSGKVMDFAGIELQTLDTTGTVWPERQRFLRKNNIKVRKADAASDKEFGMNWKMTAKTILVQLHHKVQTFEHLNKHLILIVQDCLLDYMRKEFSFGHLSQARAGDPMHLHGYSLVQAATGYTLQLQERLSTDANGIAQCLGLQGSPRVELQIILEQIESKLPQSTLLAVGKAIPVPPSARDLATDDS
jgi:Restriction endonuclease NotI